MPDHHHHYDHGDSNSIYIIAYMIFAFMGFVIGVICGAWLF